MEQTPPMTRTLSFLTMRDCKTCCSPRELTVRRFQSRRGVWLQLGGWIAACALLWSASEVQGLRPARSAWAQDLVATTEPLTPAEEQQKFRLPPGFVIELVACEPAISKPINIKFDAAGRLLVADTLEYPYPVTDGRKPRDTVRIIVDSDGDGRPDQVHTLADGMNIPIGLTPVQGGVLSYSIPTLAFLPLSAGELKAGPREPRYQSFGFQDTHGMCSSLNWWLDGWVYGCHGFANQSRVKGIQGPEISMHSGNTYRLRPDGSHIEYLTHGQVNPFGMSIDQWGYAYTADCHSRPATQLIPGAYYSSFGKPHDGLGYGPDLLQHAHGSTGIAGVAIYEDQQFAEEFRGNLFLGNPVTGRINRDRIEWTGASPRAVELPDLLSCDDPWFRPVDVQLGPDGCLYVADFYNRIIGHYEVPLDHPGRDRDRGRIWRIRYPGPEVAKASVRLPPPAGQNVTQLIASLKDANAVNRLYATHELVARGSNAVQAPLLSALQSPAATPHLLVHGLWAAQRLGLVDRELMSRLLQHTNSLVRAHAVRVASERGETSVLRAALGDPDAHVRRAAAESIGRQGPIADRVVISELIAAWTATPADDPFLIHALRIALRNQLQGRSADQFVDPRHPAEAERIADVISGLATPEAAVFLHDHGLLGRQRGGPTDWLLGRVDELVLHLLRHAPGDRLAEWQADLAVTLKSRRALPEQLQLLRRIDQAVRERGQQRVEAITTWAVEAVQSALSQDPGQTEAALELARETRLTEVGDLVAIRAADRSGSVELRWKLAEALTALGHPQALATSLSFLTDDGVAMERRHQAAQQLGALNSPDANRSLVEQLRVAPQALAAGIARALVQTQGGAESLLESLELGRGDPRLLQDATVAQKLPTVGARDWEQRRDQLVAGLPAADEQRQSMLNARADAYASAAASTTIDPERGRVLFEKNCANCHQLNQRGGKVGPSLDGVGIRGVARMLEDILEPNRNIDNAFRATLLQLADGRTVSGLALREEGEILIIADDQGREQRVPLAEIEERQLAKLSPMPANIAERLSEAELNDLLGFLLAQRVQPVQEP